MRNFLVILALGLLLSGNAFSKTNCLKTRENNCIENDKKVLSSYEDLDLISKPKKVLSNNDTKSLWNAYKKAPECFEHTTYGYGVGYKLKKIQKKNSRVTPGLLHFINMKKRINIRSN